MAAAAVGDDRADPVQTASDLLVSGNPSAALEILGSFLEANPSHADAHRMNGIAHSLLGHRSAALTALKRAVELDSGSPANHLALGQALSQFGEGADAEASFQEALWLDSQLAPAHEGLALALALSGKVEQAEDRFSSALALALDPGSRLRLHVLRGRAREQLQETEAAAQDYRAATDISPSYGPAQLGLGRCLYALEKGAEAEAALAKAVAHLEDSFEAHYLYGQQLLRGGNAEAAVGPLRRATQLDPSNREAGYALGRALRTSGSGQEARDLLAGMAREASAQAGGEAELNEAGQINNEGIAAEKAGDFGLALERYERASELVPDNLDFQRNAALTLGRLGRWAEAKQRLRAILEKAPGDVDATKALYIALDYAPDQP